MDLKDFLAAERQKKQKPIDAETEFRIGYGMACRGLTQDLAYWNRAFAGVEQRGRGYFSGMSEPAIDGAIAVLGKISLDRAGRHYERVVRMCSTELIPLNLSNLAPVHQELCNTTRILRHVPSVLFGDEHVRQSYEKLITALRNNGADSYADDLIRQLGEEEAAKSPQTQAKPEDAEKPKGE